MRRQEVQDFLKYLKTPLDIADPKYWNPKELSALRSYQSLAPKLFDDLKVDGCLGFADIFPTQSAEAIDEIRRQDDRIRKLTLITTNIANNLPKSSKFFGAEEQWFIFLSLYQATCEQIKGLFLDSVEKINKGLPSKKRERLKGFVTLGSLINVLRRYKSGRYAKLFSEVDVDLRNSAAHFTYEFLNDDIKYRDNKTTSTLDLIFQYRKISALLAILFGNKIKAFAKEFEQLAKKLGM